MSTAIHGQCDACRRESPLSESFIKGDLVCDPCEDMRIEELIAKSQRDGREFDAETDRWSVAMAVVAWLAIAAAMASLVGST